MAIPGYMTNVNTAAVRVHGETVTLANGETVTAIFDLNNQPGWGYGTELLDALEQQPQPTLHLTDDDASAHQYDLEAGMRLEVRGVGYLIAEEPEHLGDGMTRLALTAETL
jgi:hypothetical protein